MCYDCELTFPKKEYSSGVSAAEIVDHLFKLSQLTPLQVIANVLQRGKATNDVFRSLLTAYDSFLGILDNPTKRKYLDEELSRESAASDKIYADVRRLSGLFQNALTDLFFDDRKDNKFLELTKTYGVF